MLLEAGLALAVHGRKRQLASVVLIGHCFRKPRGKRLRPFVLLLSDSCPVIWWAVPQTANALEFSLQLIALGFERVEPLVNVRDLLLEGLH